MKRALLLAAITLALAACADGFGVRTEWTGDVPSGCEKADAAYAAHMMACRVKPKAKACTTDNIRKANAINAEAIGFCAGAPPSTGENISTIDDLVRRQLAVGR